MNWYVKRTGQALFTLWAVTTIAFVLTRLMPGNAVDRRVNEIIRNQGSVDQGEIESIRENVNSQLIVDPNAPIGEAYVAYMSELLTGNLGYSISAQRSLNDLMADAVPWTLFVMALATFGLFSISLALGAIQAYKEGSIFDTGMTLIDMATTSVPYYVAGILLIIYVGFSDAPILEYFPTELRKPPGSDEGFNVEFIVGAFRHATLPALSYVLTAYGLMALSMRGNSIQILGEDYVRVAELRGLPERRIALRYVGRNAILPMYTSLLLSIGFMLGASVILEQIFNYHGVGYWMNQALEDMDTALMMAIFLMITFSVIIAMFIADLTYGMLDPRIKSGDEGEAY